MYGITGKRIKMLIDEVVYTLKYKGNVVHTSGSKMLIPSNVKISKEEKINRLVLCDDIWGFDKKIKNIRINAKRR